MIEAWDDCPPRLWHAYTAFLNVVRRCADGSIVSAVLYSHDPGRPIRRRAADARVCLCASCHCPDRLCSNAKTGRAGPSKHASLADRVRYDRSGASHGAANLARAVFSHFANPIWESASTALGRSIMPSLSIDPGATLFSLCRYLAWLGVGLLAAAITIDRQRAEWVLFAVTAATVLIAALLILNDAAGSTLLAEVQNVARRGGALNAAALGVVLSVACADRAYERFETRRSTHPRSGPRLARNFLLCVVAFIVCAAAVAQAHSANSLFAAAIGLVILLAVIMIRRFGLGLGGACSVALIGCVLALAFFGERSSQNGLDFSIRFAPKSVSSSAMAQRLLADSTWIGTGAGTYHDLVPIYRDPDKSTGNEYPPTAAGQFSVEWGRPLFWAGVIIVIVMIVKLARSGLNRGRDSFYPAGGASALAVLLILGLATRD